MKGILSQKAVAANMEHAIARGSKINPYQADGRDFPPYMPMPIGEVRSLPIVVPA
jgi:hypothetical protein